MNTAEIHTIEHLGATFLRNETSIKIKSYFGPMGCRMVLHVFAGNYVSSDV